MRAAVLLVGLLFALALTGSAAGQDPVEEMLVEGAPQEETPPAPVPEPRPEPEVPPAEPLPPEKREEKAAKEPPDEDRQDDPEPKGEDAKPAPSKPAPAVKKIESKKDSEENVAPSPASPPATSLAPPAGTLRAGETTVVSTLFRAIGAREPGLLAVAGGFGALALLVGAVTITSARRNRSARGFDEASANLVGSLASRPKDVATPGEPSPKELAAAGEAVVRRARPERVEDGLELLSALGYGDAALVSESDVEAIVEVRRCSSCLRATGDEPCHFEIGFIRGVFESAWREPARVSEVACGRGERPCTFRALKARP